MGCQGSKHEGSKHLDFYIIKPPQGGTELGQSGEPVSNEVGRTRTKGRTQVDL